MNFYLKKSFRRLQSRIVNGINVASTIDHLFENEIISDDDMRDLLRKDGRDQCRHLLSLLHSANHPAAFVELRASLLKEKAYRHIVDELDELAQKQVTDQLI